MDEATREAVEIGEETMLGDLMKCVQAELQVMPKAWQAMSQSQQDEALERIEKQIRTAADQAVNIIASRNMPNVVGTVDSVTFKGGAKATIKFGQITPGVHALADAEGHFVTISIPETDDLLSDEGKPEGEADQRGLDLGHEYNENEEHEGEPFINADNSDLEDQLTDALDAADASVDSLYEEAVTFVRETGKASISAVQRKLKVGYNRAARLIESMEKNGVVSVMASNGSRTVIAQPEPDPDA